ncbi:MAG: hypothetical protein RL701_6125, partial [Pseudomonadota bacterium]
RSNTFAPHSQHTLSISPRSRPNANLPLQLRAAVTLAAHAVGA